MPMTFSINDSQHNDTQQKHQVSFCNVSLFYPYAQCLSVLSLIFDICILNVVVLTVVMLSSVTMNVVAPFQRSRVRISSLVKEVGKYRAKGSTFKATIVSRQNSNQKFKKLQFS